MDKETLWLIESSTYISKCTLLRYVSILFLNILTLLAPTQATDNMFYSCTVPCENENVLISSLHCFFAHVTLSSSPFPILNREKIFMLIFSYPFNIINTSI